MLYDVAVLTVRVQPRSSRPGIEVRDDEVVVRVAAPPADQRATDEARRRLADGLGVPVSAVRLRSGARSRRKLFEVDGLDEERLRTALRTLP